MPLASRPDHYTNLTTIMLTTTVGCDASDRLYRPAYDSGGTSEYTSKVGHHRCRTETPAFRRRKPSQTTHDGYIHDAPAALASLLERGVDALAAAEAAKLLYQQPLPLYRSNSARPKLHRSSSSIQRRTSSRIALHIYNYHDIRQ